MIKWIDIISPELRAIHQRWCMLRGERLMPHLRNYNEFSTAGAAETMITALFPVGAEGPEFHYVGRELRLILPQCQTGRSFARVTDLTARATIVNAFFRVRSARQPDCLRGELRAGKQTLPYEHLILPFANEQIRVCLIYSSFMFYP